MNGTGGTSAPPTPRSSRPSWIAAGIVTTLYAAVVVFAAAHHELWRDEVVPLSLAQQLPSLGDLWHMLRHEGHPVLWYLILRWSWALVGSNLVLPTLATAVACAAVFLFVARAPLPLWISCLFVFGYFPLYEYAVMARGNGLVMLLLFAFCALYPVRRERPYAMALVLGALANVTAMGFLVAAAAGAAIVVDALVARKQPLARSHAVASLLYLALVLHSPLSTMPDRSVLPLALYHHDVGTIASAAWRALTRPGIHAAPFYRLPYFSVWILLFWLLLLPRPALLVFAVASFVGFEMVFDLVYPGSPRHIGYFLLIVMATLWLGAPWDRDDARGGVMTRLQRGLRFGLMAPLTLALLTQVDIGARAILDDVRGDASSSKRLAEIIAADPSLAHAIVIAEPETLGLSLRYYRDNPIYLPQEQAFRDWLLIQVPGGRRHELSLGELLATATEMRDRRGVPVVIALGWRLDGPDVQRAYNGTYFDQTFTLDATARTAFLRRVELLQRLRNAPSSDENYDVFVLR